MNGGPSGFNNAPVTRAFVIASGIFTVFFGIQGRFNKLGHFQKFSLVEVDCVWIFLFICARIDVWAVSAILLQGV
ncbi:hypothetical protein Pint_18522 [Pistacia integerrima]|uniref:Uncharacterized protein n=1 Tax=Pistacia integerrima TaxID=434235 RepID=A0ACC0YUS0_9ROSI|nr:hypothetical protein Pint_18522 [Pistacia integerrima]